MFPFSLFRRKKKFRKPAPPVRLGARLFRLTLRLFVLVLVLGALGLGVWFGVALYNFVYKSSYFEYDADQITLRFDESSLSGEEPAIRVQVLRRLRWKKLDQGNLLELNAEELRKEIENHPKVRKAAVRKVFPNALDVEIAQREPVALLVQDGILTVDREGVVLEAVDTRDPRSLLYPFITGIEQGRVEPGTRIQSESLTKALELLICVKDKEASLFDKISEVHCDRERNLTLILKGGTQIRFGAADPVARMPKLDTVFKEMGPPEQFEYIDLRLDDQVPVMPKSSVASPEGASVTSR
jgi:cell division protein FtsQ